MARISCPTSRIFIQIGLSVAKNFESGNRMVTDFPTDGHNKCYRSQGIIWQERVSTMWIALIVSTCVLIQAPSVNPDTLPTNSEVRTFRSSRPLTSAQRARAALMPKYTSTPLSSVSGMSSGGATAAQAKATSLVTLNRAKRSSQYVPEDINDKMTWKRQGIATSTPWEREVGGWEKRPDWKPKNTWDGSLTHVTGGSLAGTPTSGRQTYDVKHPNLVVNGKVPVKRR